MAYFTRAEIESKIKKTSDAIDAVMTGQSYSLDTGQGRMSVTRASLPMLQKHLDYWLNELRQTEDSDIKSIEVGR